MVYLRQKQKDEIRVRTYQDTYQTLNESQQKPMVRYHDTMLVWY